MRAKHTTAHIGREPPSRGALPAQLERLDQTIATAERHVEAQQRLIAEATLAGRNTAQAAFELQKLQLLIAILREGRERLLERSA